MFGLIGKIMKKLRLKKLLKRAGMNEYQYNTRVVVSTPTDDSRRISIGGMNYDNNWGDCISLSVLLNVESRTWDVMLFSPARARLIANYLIEQADIMEKADPDSMEIDKAEDKRR